MIRPDHHLNHRSKQRGAGSVLMLAIAACAVVLAGLVGLAGQAVILRHRAQAAADLSALAAAAPGGGCSAGERVARANGACLGSCIREPGGAVSVTVSQPCPGAAAATSWPGLGAQRAVSQARAGLAVPAPS